MPNLTTGGQENKTFEAKKCKPNLKGRTLLMCVLILPAAAAAVIILSLLLFVAFGTWFSPRSARVVWHIAAVRIIRRLLRRGRSHSLKRERKSQMMRLTYFRLSIVSWCAHRSIRQSHPVSVLFRHVFFLFNRISVNRKVP